MGKHTIKDYVHDGIEFTDFSFVIEIFPSPVPYDACDIPIDTCLDLVLMSAHFEFNELYLPSGPFVYPFFYSQKSFKTGFSANSLTQTFALMYAGAGMEGATSHTGRRTFLTKLANQNTPIHLLKTLAGHKSISTTATYLYSNPTLLKAAVELA